MSDMSMVESCVGANFDYGFVAATGVKLGACPKCKHMLAAYRTDGVVFCPNCNYMQK